MSLSVSCDLGYEPDQSGSDCDSDCDPENPVEIVPKPRRQYPETPYYGSDVSTEILSQSDINNVD
jgi:hypothetical protein